jgi:predicted phage terminase large subunit-like protein
MASSVGGAVTGEGGDRIVCDDPHNVQEAESDAVRRSTIEWWDIVMSTRLNDPKTSAKVVVMQRCHEQDLSGHLLAQGGWDHLSLPAEYEGTPCVTTVGWSDPRSEQDELLWPERFGRDEIDDLKRSLGSYGAAGQLQQRPSPAGGGVFKRHWWRYWRPEHLELPPVVVRMPDGELRSIPAVPLPTEFDTIVQSWDLAFKDLATSDYVVGQVWGAVRADRFLLDQRRDHMDMPKTLQAIRALSERWPEAWTKLIEDKANGPAVVAALRHEIAGLIAVNPDGGKVARAQAVSPQCESGNVYLPHPTIAPWVDGLIDESAGFPNAAHDDQVDSLSQALNRLTRSSGVMGLVEYLKGIADGSIQEPTLSEKEVPVLAGQPSACPSCSGKLLQKIPGGQTRCGACGHQFYAHGTGPPTIAGPVSRRDLQF